MIFGFECVQPASHKYVLNLRETSQADLIFIWSSLSCSRLKNYWSFFLCWFQSENQAPHFNSSPIKSWENSQLVILIDERFIYNSNMTHFCCSKGFQSTCYVKIIIIFISQVNYLPFFFIVSPSMKKNSLQCLKKIIQVDILISWDSFTPRRCGCFSDFIM